MSRTERGIADGWLILIVLAVIAGGLWYAYQTIDSRGYARGAADIQAKWDAANEKQRKDEADKSAKAATGLEKGNAAAKVIYRTITNTVDKYIDRPIYRNVCFDDNGLRDANAALVGALTPAAKPDGTMPKPDATSGRSSGNSPAKVD